tara:strand:+ start:20911 stop:23832 length:2922 start_codon:yes stop_codon:yes gene_type:complete
MQQVPLNSDEETKDLLSREEVSYIDLLCEGPIAGPVDKNGNLVMTSSRRQDHRNDVGAKILYESIYLNDVPVKNFNVDTYNFRYVDSNMRLGHKEYPKNNEFGRRDEWSQPYENYPFDEQRNTTQLNSKLIGWWAGTDTQGQGEVAENVKDAENKGATPASFMILNPDVRFIILNLTVNLSDFSDSGGKVNGSSISLGIVAQCENATEAAEQEYNVAARTKNIEASYDNSSSKNHITIIGSNDPASNGSNKIKISGKATNPAVVSIRIRLPEAKNPNNKNRIIRIYKLNAERDAEGRTKLNQSAVLSSVVECIPCKLKFPYCATASLSVDSRGIGSNPKRSYDLKLLKVAVPSNYTPWNENTKRGDTLYNGAWDGTFKLEWTSNPAWCFFDLLTNRKHALGKFGITLDQIDKWSLYEIAKYCDAVDENGKWIGVLKYGSTTEAEPRYTCNVLIDQRQEAFDLLYNMASIFNGMLYWGFGSVFAAVDKEKETVMHFSDADISEDGFNYSSSPKTTRITVAKVRFNDADDNFRSKIEYVEDADAIRKYGIVEKDVVAFGCTSRGQAYRLAKWILITSQYETETIQFKAGMKASYLRPGDVFSVFDHTAEDQRFAGKITNVNLSESSIKIDYPILHLTNGSSDFPLKISISTPMEGGDLPKDQLSRYGIERIPFSKDYLVTSISDDGQTLSLLNTDLQTKPTELYRVPVGSSWIINDETKNPETRIRKFSTIAINQEEQNEYSIVAVEYVDEKYGDLIDAPRNKKRNKYSLAGLDLAEENFIADPQPSQIYIGFFMDPSLFPPGVPAIDVDDIDRMTGLPYQALIFWDHVPFADAYVIHWKFNNQTEWEGKPGNTVDGLQILGARDTHDPGRIPPANSSFKNGGVDLWASKKYFAQYYHKPYSTVQLPKAPGKVTVEAYTIKNGVWSSNRYSDYLTSDDPLSYEDVEYKPPSTNAGNPFNFSSNLAATTWLNSIED